MTPRAAYAYADFFARLPAAILFVCVMSFTIEYLVQRGAR